MEVFLVYARSAAWETCHLSSPRGPNAPPRPVPGWLPLEMWQRAMPGSASSVAEHRTQGVADGEESGPMTESNKHAVP